MERASIANGRRVINGARLRCIRDSRSSRIYSIREKPAAKKSSSFCSRRAREYSRTRVMLAFYANVDRGRNGERSVNVRTAILWRKEMRSVFRSFFLEYYVGQDLKSGRVKWLITTID